MHKNYLKADTWIEQEDVCVDPEPLQGAYSPLAAFAILANFCSNSLVRLRQCRIRTRTSERKLKHWVVLVLMLVTGCAPARESAGPVTGTNGVSFYFVQISDTHWGARDGIAMTRSAIELINRLPVSVEFVTITGDLFADSIRKEQVVREGVDVLKGLKVPVYCVPGNHDLIQSDFSHTKGIFEEYFGPASRKVMVKGVACLFFCTEQPGGAQTECQELDKLLRDSAGPVLVFMHRPPLHDLLGNEGEDPEKWRELADSRWVQLFEKHPAVKGIFAGHFHRDEMAWIGAVPVYVAPAVARFWDRQPALRLYEYKNGRINYWTLYPERSQKL